MVDDYENKPISGVIVILFEKLFGRFDARAAITFLFIQCVRIKLFGPQLLTACPIRTIR